jgi:NitT/TauT family transport system substrate-binding protein
MNRAAFATLAGAAVVFPRRVSAQSAALRIATIPIESAAEVYYARELGFFAGSGITVDILPFQNGEAIASAVVSNSADIGYATITPLAVAHSKGIPFTILAGGALTQNSTPFAYIAVPASSTIRTGADINGKTFAIIGLGTIADYGVRAWIDRNGGDSSTVKFTEMPAPLMPAALVAGRVDAALLVEPFVSQGRALGLKMLDNPMAAVSKEYVSSAWFSTPQWADAHADLAKRFTGVMHDTAIWAAHNAARSTAILADVTKSDAANLAKIPRVQYADHLTAALIQPVIDISAKYGKFAPFSGRELIYGSR